jgi:hypothetical protein
VAGSGQGQQKRVGKDQNFETLQKRSNAASEVSIEMSVMEAAAQGVEQPQIYLNYCLLKLMLKDVNRTCEVKTLPNGQDNVSHVGLDCFCQCWRQVIVQFVLPQWWQEEKVIKFVGRSGP